MTYKIIRFFKDGRPNELVNTGLTLKEAKEHCQREDTHKKDKEGNVLWFDGYQEA